MWIQEHFGSAQVGSTKKDLPLFGRTEAKVDGVAGMNPDSFDEDIFAKRFHRPILAKKGSNLHI
jgi:hypothetical protein